MFFLELNIGNINNIKKGTKLRIFDGVINTERGREE